MSKANRDAVKAAAYTALWTFAGMFGLALTGWLADVQSWATADGAGTVFPDPAVLVKAAIAAVAAGAGFVVAAVVRLAQANNVLPGAPPAYIEQPARGDRGAVDVLYVLLVVLVVIVIFSIL